MSSRVCINFDNPRKDLTGFILGNVVVIMLCESLAFVSLWFLVEFWKLRNEKQFIRHRHPRLAVAIVGCTIPIIGVLVPLASNMWSIECLSDISVLITNNHKATNRGKDSVIILFVVFFFAWLFLIVLRVWLSRYDYEHKLATKYSFWQKDLGYTSKHNTTEEYQGQWWIDNKFKFGEELPMIKILAGFYIVVVIIAIVLSPVNPEFEDQWDFFLYWCAACAVITCFFLFLNVYKVRTIHDAFHIKNEIMLFTKVSLVVAVAMLTAFMIGRLYSKLFYHYATVISGMIFNLLLFNVSFVSTKWVMQEDTRQNQKQKEYLLNNLSEDFEGDTTLKTVLSTKDGFEIFMDFLVTEYSTENLLCYVECTQFLRRWKHKINKMKKETQRQVAGSSMAAMAAVATSQLTADDKLKKPSLTSENSTSQLGSIKKQLTKQLGNDDSSSSEDSEDEYKLEDKEHNVVVESKHAMLNRIGFLKKSKILKDNDLTFYGHFEYLFSKYVSKSSTRQINIRAALYKRFDKVKPEDCDFSTLDLKSISMSGIFFSNDKPNNNVRSGSLYSQNRSLADKEHSPGPAISVADSNTVGNRDDLGITHHMTTGSASENVDDTPNANENNERNRLNSKKNEVNEKSPGSTSVYGGAVISLEMNRQASTNTETRAVYGNAPQTPSRSRRTSKNLHGVPMVLKLIDDTRKALWKLMQDSFVRFRSTEQYYEYLQNLERNKSVSHKN